MTSKTRAELKAQANHLPALFQVGKGGVSEALLNQTRDAFRTRELIKLKALLETIPEPPEALAEQIAEGCGAEVVQVIGGSMIFYKENPELREKAKQKKKAAAQKPGVGIRARKVKQAREQRKAPQDSTQRSTPQHGVPKRAAAQRGAAPYRASQTARGKRPGKARNPK